MALDVGDRRIGVAIADESETIATPIGRVERGGGGGRGRGRGGGGGDAAALAELGRLTAEWGVDRLVVGLPTGLSGREGPQAASVRAFAAVLRGALGPDPPEILFWDERLTTAIAERALVAAGARRERRRREIDAVAAAVILQSFLDAARSRRQRVGG